MPGQQPPGAWMTDAGFIGLHGSMSVCQTQASVSMLTWLWRLSSCKGIPAFLCPSHSSINQTLCSKTPAPRWQFLFHYVKWMVLRRCSNVARKFVDRLNDYPLIQRDSALRRQLTQTAVKATS
jgi:hypothetical protein